MGVIMSGEWSKFAQIMRREGQKFKRAMKADVSITSILSLDKKMLTGAGIITQQKKELSSLEVVLVLLCCKYCIILLLSRAGSTNECL